MLPAHYVTAHVELAYATTAHGTQGDTVTAAHVVVGEGRGRDGRKTFTEGAVHAGDRLCAESEALFVAVDFLKLDHLRRERDAAFAPGGAEA